MGRGVLAAADRPSVCEAAGAALANQDQPDLEGAAAAYRVAVELGRVEVPQAAWLPEAESTLGQLERLLDLDDRSGEQEQR